MSESIKTLFIVGPTASGKSALAMQLAAELDAEIVCADSQTLRRGLDMGTAKPSKADQARIPHHLIDIIDPYEDFSAAAFKAAAEQALEAIHATGKLAIVVGGTGLYVDALYYTYSFEGKAADPELRNRLNQMSVEQLQAKIRDKNLPMPFNDQNPRHLIRTIESGGMKALNKTPRPQSLIIGLNPGREVIKQRIALRAKSLLAHGFLDEVDEVVKKYGYPSRQFDAIAYKIALNNLHPRDEAHIHYIEQAITVAESQYAKRQIAWFKRNQQITWFETAESAAKFVHSQIKP